MDRLRCVGELYTAGALHCIHVPCLAAPDAVDEETRVDLLVQSLDRVSSPHAFCGTILVVGVPLLTSDPALSP